MYIKSNVGTCFAALIACIANSAFAADCGRVQNTPQKMQSGVAFATSILNVDADGAPNSYRVDGNGLSYTCDGVTAVGSTPKTDPEHWQEKCRAAWRKAVQTNDYSGVRIFGFAKNDKNEPLVQKDGDPLPGEAYVTETRVPVPDGPLGTQRHWVDANKIPYIVLTKGFVSKFQVGPGDVAAVYWPASEKMAFAVYGDEGGDLGEASVKLHQDIGNNPLVNRGGTLRAKRGIEGRVITIVFPGHRTTPTVDSQKWLSEIKKVGEKALNDWGGETRLKSCR